MTEIDAPPIPSHLDIEAEHGAVSAALTTATLERHRIEQAIRQTTCIEALSGLHERWGEIIEEQAQAAARRAELSAMLADD